MILSLFTKKASHSVISDFNHIAKVNVILFGELGLAYRFPTSTDGQKRGIEEDADAFGYGDEMIRLIRHHALNVAGLRLADKVNFMQQGRVANKTIYTDGAYSLLIGLASLEHMADAYYQHYSKDEEIFAMLNAQMRAVAPVTSRMLRYGEPGQDFRLAFPRVTEGINRYQSPK